MRTREIAVSIGATINMGNYENVKPVVSITMELDEGDNVQEAYKAAWTIVTEQLRQQWKSIRSTT